MPLILHTSDTHLGYAQFDLLERENDVYEAFNEVIETAVKDRVDAVIHSGDIFHVPKPGGRPLVKLAEGVKTLADKGIKFYFNFGEHDANQVWGTPSSYLFHKLGLATYIGDGRPVIDGDLMVVGFQKRKKGNVDDLFEAFKEADEAARQHPEKKKVAVIHQGLYELHKFGGEITANDLPRRFDYYAMGHLHDHSESRFEQLGGPLCYPGSLDPTDVEGIHDFKKGFYMVDLSGSEAKPEWIEVKSSRRQFRFDVEYARLKEEVAKISKEIDGKSLAKKPVILLRVKGTEIDNGKVNAALGAFRESCLLADWTPLLEESGSGGGSILAERPTDIQQEMLALAVKALGTEAKASFAVNELLPLLAAGNQKDALELVTRTFEESRLSKKDSGGGGASNA
jgi:DNA repair exonuclease SbcCD nuclease subunit